MSFDVHSSGCPEGPRQLNMPICEYVCSPLMRLSIRRYMAVIWRHHTLLADFAIVLCDIQDTESLVSYIRILPLQICRSPQSTSHDCILPGADNLEVASTHETVDIRATRCSIGFYNGCDCRLGVLFLAGGQFYTVVDRCPRPRRRSVGFRTATARMTSR